MFIVQLQRIICWPSIIGALNATPIELHENIYKDTFLLHQSMHLPIFIMWDCNAVRDEIAIVS